MTELLPLCQGHNITFNSPWLLLGCAVWDAKTLTAQDMAVRALRESRAQTGQYESPRIEFY